jgi:hypothetical protein
MTAEAKLRLLASQDEALQSYFLGTNGTFRWFTPQLQPGYISQGACVRVLRIATGRLNAHKTRTASHSVDQQQPRFQIDVLSQDASQAREAAAEICNWLTTRADFSSDDLFSSPAVTPNQHPNFILNQRAGMEPQTQPPVYVEILDVRLWDQQEISQ